MLWVDDVKAAIDYYKNVLGFTEAHFETDWQWGSVRRDGIEIMFASQTNIRFIMVQASQVHCILMWTMQTSGMKV